MLPDQHGRIFGIHNAASRARFLIRDRDGKFPSLFDTVLKEARITVVLRGSRCRG